VDVPGSGATTGGLLEEEEEDAWRRRDDGDGDGDGAQYEVEAMGDAIGGADLPAIALFI
jgi:hypothetical protein